MYIWTVCTHIHTKARKKGPEVNIRGRHLQVHLSSHSLILKKRCCLFFFKSLNISLKHFHTIFHQLVKKREFNVCTTCCTYIPTNPPLLGQYLVCSINCHRAHVSTHTHKNTLFLTFLLLPMILRLLYINQIPEWLISGSSYLSLTEALWRRAKRDTRALLINKITSLTEMFNGERKEEQTDEYPVQVCSWNGWQ